ncbi:ribonuclease H family protein [Priestia abyssalis]|uniref:ribonuclease H family protein n=1 Tax=Priestia abyssalis TaxID=1221450 RepID=UPI0009953D89|nr:ribonuclease H family protein [Priestia abyssalis]
MKFQIEWHYKIKSRELTFLSEYTNAEEALLIVEDLEKTGRTKEIFLLDEQQNIWTIKEAKKLVKQVETEPDDITVYFDGGFDLDLNKAGLGAAIYYMQNRQKFRIRENTRVEQLNSNNEAEYAAFYFALQQLEAMGVSKASVVFRGDSQVVLKQLSGEWPCFEEEFNRWLDRIEEKMKELKIHPVYESISRKQNQEADQLATQALQGTDISSHKQIED